MYRSCTQRDGESDRDRDRQHLLTPPTPSLPRHTPQVVDLARELAHDSSRDVRTATICLLVGLLAPVAPASAFSPAGKGGEVAMEVQEDVRERGFGCVAEMLADCDRQVRCLAAHASAALLDQQAAPATVETELVKALADCKMDPCQQVREAATTALRLATACRPAIGCHQPSHAACASESAASGISDAPGTSEANAGTAAASHASRADPHSRPASLDPRVGVGVGERGKGGEAERSERGTEGRYRDACVTNCVGAIAMAAERWPFVPVPPTDRHESNRLGWAQSDRYAGSATALLHNQNQAGAGKVMAVVAPAAADNRAVPFKADGRDQVDAARPSGGGDAAEQSSSEDARLGREVAQVSEISEISVILGQVVRRVAYDEAIGCLAPALLDLEHEQKRLWDRQPLGPVVLAPSAAAGGCGHVTGQGGGGHAHHVLGDSLVACMQAGEGIGRVGALSSHGSDAPRCGAPVGPGAAAGAARGGEWAKAKPRVLGSRTPGG